MNSSVTGLKTAEERRVRMEKESKRILPGLAEQVLDTKLPSGSTSFRSEAVAVLRNWWQLDL